MLNDTTVANLIVMLAEGKADKAKSYLSHFARADRAPPAVRARLASQVAPEVMEVFERLAPWLVLDVDDDTEARVLAALKVAGEAGLNVTELHRTVRRVAPERMDSALESLVAAGEVHFQREKTHGRTASRYRLAEHGRGVEPANEMLDPFAWRPAPFVPDSELG